MIQLIGLLLLPIVGIIAILLKTRIFCYISEEKIALSITLAVIFLFFLGLLIGFSPFNVVVDKSIDFAFNFQLNGLSLPFMLIAIMLPALALLPAHKEIKENKALFYIIYLLILLSLVASFMSYNLLSFFVFWEIILVAFFFVIAFWGEEELKRHASMKFLIFTQVGSLTLIAAFILLFLYTGSFTLGTVISGINNIPANVSVIIFLLVLVTAIIKMPLFPLHSWLPDAHVGAPIAGSIILAGVLLKMGGYVFLRFGALLLPNVVNNFGIPLMWLGVFTAIYISFVASAQKDFKRLIAYSSILYMAIAFIGAVSNTPIGLDGAVVLMVSHAFIAGILFTLVGILKEKTGTRDLTKLGGLLSRMPIFSLMLMLAIFATLGVPGLSNFIGEFLSLLGAYYFYPLSLLALAAIIVATNYYLSAAKAILFGQLKKGFQKVSDISTLEALQLGIFMIFIIVIGVMPALLLGGFSLT